MCHNKQTHIAIKGARPPDMKQSGMEIERNDFEKAKRDGEKVMQNYMYNYVQWYM